MNVLTDWRARRAELSRQRAEIARMTVASQRRRGRLIYTQPRLFGYDTYVEFWIPRAWYLKLLAAKESRHSTVEMSLTWGVFSDVPQDAWVELTDLSDDLTHFRHPANPASVDPEEVGLRVELFGVDSQFRQFGPLCGGPGVVARYLVWRAIGSPEA